MAIPHADYGDVIDVRPLGAALSSSSTQTLLKTDQLQVVRMVMPQGKEIAEHKAPGPITVQCLEGQNRFHDSGQDPRAVSRSDALPAGGRAARFDLPGRGVVPAHVVQIVIRSGEHTHSSSSRNCFSTTALLCSSSREANTKVTLPSVVRCLSNFSRSPCSFNSDW